MIPRILILETQRDIIQQLKKIGVDKGSIPIMAPKAGFLNIKLDKMPWVSANILKQEMLSLGGDVAISRWSITGKQKTTPCLLMGNRSQFNKLIDKISKQPFQLSRLSSELKELLFNYDKNNLYFKCGRFSLKTGTKTLLMGIINVTDDSFSGDGVLKRINTCGAKLKDFVMEKAERMIEEGADIIDIGAESTRPGAKPVSAEEENKRLLPCVNILAKKIPAPISVDTYKPDTARRVLGAGASVINDITGLRSKNMRRHIKEYSAGAVIMHMKGVPRNMQRNPRYVSLLDEIIGFLSGRLDAALDSGIELNRIVVDPGIGFGKSLEHNIAILNNLHEFKVLGRPILLGVSRKSFIGAITKNDIHDRIFGTAASVAVSVLRGASIVRVHDVKEMKQIISICDTIKNSNGAL